MSRLDHDRMMGMLLEKANRILAVTASSPHGARPERLVAGDVRGICVWGNHSNSQVRAAMGMSCGRRDFHRVE